MKKIFKRLRSQRGMTLIEIMVVVAIIGIIGTVVTINVVASMEKAKVGAVKTQMRGFEAALISFRRDNGFYPTTDQGLQSLVEKPTSGKIPSDYPREGYLQGGKIPVDPWDEAYQYVSPGSSGHPYEITSYGADRKEGGDDVDKDINSWELTK